MMVINKKQVKKSPTYSGAQQKLLSTPNMKQPVGFFSTFSILDPNGTHEGSPRTQKRNRRVFVCIPCHRRKLKCDKGQPCSRCIQSGSANDCVYQPSQNSLKRGSWSKTPQLESAPCFQRERRSGGLDQAGPFYQAYDGRPRNNGITHWAEIACEFEEALPFLFGHQPQWESRYREIKRLEYLFDPHTSSNFPFGQSLAILPFQGTIISQLPPRQVVEALAGCYFQSCEITHRLFHPMQFWDELRAFWSGNEVMEDAWLSQLFMVLALGCQTAPDYVLECTGKSPSQWTESLLEAAQICFCRAPYMAAPTLTTVRTLCMMVLAEMLELVKGTSPAQIVSLMGLVSRLAMTMQLHRTATLCPVLSTFDAEMRRRTWVTIQLLDVDVAMRAGTSPLCREHSTEAPLNLNEPNIRQEQVLWAVDRPWMAPNVYTDGTFQSKVAEFLPLLAEIIDMVNSPTQPLPKYDTVLSWDKRLCRSMENILEALSLQFTSSPNMYQRALLQRQLVEVLSHRAKLALHHSFIRAPYDTRFDGSYRTVRRSSLWLLDVQETWTMPNVADAISCGSPSSPSSPANLMVASGGYANWLINLCQDDFDAAMLYLTLILRRDSFGGGILDGMPSNDGAWAVLRQGHMHVRHRACRSLQYFKQFVGLSIMTSCLQCLGNPNAMLPTLLQAADHIERTISTGIQDMLWIANGPILLAHEVLGATAQLDMDPALLSVHIE